jgi:hypothetical protein
MHRLDQVRFTLPTGELVTVTVAVDRPGIRRGGPERRQAEHIAAILWMAVQEEEAQTPTAE